MSFGNKLGRGLGTISALALEGAVRGATGLGQFGADVVDGAQTGYDEKHAALLLSRAASEQDRLTRLAVKKAAHIAAMAMVPAAEPRPAGIKLPTLRGQARFA